MSVLVMVIHMVSIHGHTRDHVEEGDAHEYEGGHGVEVVSVGDATVPDCRQDQPEQREHQRAHVKLFVLQKISLK